MKARYLTLGVALGVLGATAHADVYSWVQWNSPVGNTVTGSISTSNGPVGVTVTGPFFQVLTNYPSWTPTTSYADGTIIDNAPDNTSIVQILTTGSFNVSFNTTVKDLAFSVWSVGQGGLPVTYAFDKNLTFVVGGPGAEFGGGSITTTATTLTGVEGNGSVLFEDSLSVLNFEVQNAENWHGFNLGLKYEQPVPEPATMATLALGAAALLRRRRRV